MARTSKSRVDLLKQLEETLRKVGAQSVLLSDTVARLVGVNSTDLECLDLLEMAGPTTAGRLAEHAGLTTGAMTAVIMSNTSSWSSMPLPRTLLKLRWTCRAVASASCAMWRRTIQGASCIL